MKQPLVIAHRGASRDAPENTLAAFRLAWEQGADAIETDLRRTADGAIIAFHDVDGRRILGDPRPIHTIPLAVLRTLDAGRWKHPRWLDQPVPTLAEILALTPHDKQLVLELKEDLVSDLTRALPAAFYDRVTLLAFDRATITKAKTALPGCRALWLFGDFSKLRRGNHGAQLARHVRELGVDGVDLRYSRHLSLNLLASLRMERLSIFTYTVNHSLSIRRSQRLGLDGVTTDRPGDAKRWLGIST